MSSTDSIVNEIINMSPPLALIALLNLIGFSLKKSPIKDGYIPLVLIVIGGAVYPYISDIGQITFKVRNPFVLQAIYGALFGGASVGINQVWKQFMGGEKKSSEDTVKQTQQQQQPDTDKTKL